MSFPVALLLTPALVRPRPVPFRPTPGTLCNHKAKAGKVSERDEERTSCHLPFGIDYLYYYWELGVVVQWSSRCLVVVRGQTSEHLSSRVCEDPMHCCRPVHDTKFWRRPFTYPAHELCTHESRDDEVQYMDYGRSVYPSLTLHRFR